MTCWSWVRIRKQPLCICRGKAAYNIPPPYLRIVKSLWAMGYEVFLLIYTWSLYIFSLTAGIPVQIDFESHGFNVDLQSFLLLFSNNFQFSSRQTLRLLSDHSFKGCSNRCSFEMKKVCLTFSFLSLILEVILEVNIWKNNKRKLRDEIWSVLENMKKRQMMK